MNLDIGSQEFQALAVLANRHLPREEILARTRSLSGLDVGELLELGKLHQLMPLVYYTICEKDLAGYFPSESLDLFKDHYALQLKRQAVLREELARVLPQLEREGIDVVPLKGLALGEWVYPAAEVRPLSDIDLLFDHAALERLPPLLEGLGYRMIEQDRGYLHHTVFERTVRKETVRIECHGRLWLDIRYGYDLGGLMSRARPRRLAGAPVKAMALEDLLCHICCHVASQHYLRVPLLWLHDMNELLCNETVSLDWGLVRSLSARYHLDAMIYWCFALSQWLFHTQALPKEVESMRPAGPMVELFRLHLRLVDPFSRYGRPWYPGDLLTLAFMFDSPLLALKWLVKRVGSMPGAPSI